jgi:signal transduction histidine kinase
MAVYTVDLDSPSRRLAAVLLGDVERIAERSAARMQEVLPSYAKVPRSELVPVVLANERNLLEAICDPDADPGRAQDQFRISGHTRARQGITSDEMLNGWRVALEVIREQASATAEEFGIAKDDLLEFVVATLQWGDVGMRASASAHHDAEIRELGRLVKEQAALRRVATMVAQERPAKEVFAQVAEEVGLLLEVEAAVIRRFGPSGHATAVGVWGELADPPSLGARGKLAGRMTELVYRTARPVRLDDLEHVAGPIAAGERKMGLRSAVASPIFVNGSLWGAIFAATSTAKPMPADAESRIAQFTELVATAISNLQARSDLASSRARIAAAADEERRRVVRDLHDGAQQRLVHTVVTLKLARRALELAGEDAAALVDEALQHAQAATTELRELAHGILPAALTTGGLRAAVGALASRTPILVEVEVSVDRLPGAVEATAYFIVAEALTNVAKHAHAQTAKVRARLDGGMLRVVVSDDGVGGAQECGSGLLGLHDRLAAGDGTLTVDSPIGHGTVVSACIPVA